MQKKILAIVVTYNPGSYLEKNLKAIVAQAAKVLVVDNGSGNINFVKDTACAAGCFFIGNTDNLGIATALNQGARMAVEEGFEWLATFDQDSFLFPDTLTGLLQTYDTYPSQEKIAILAASHRDRVMGKGYHSRVDILDEKPLWRVLRSTITSGSLIRVEVFSKVGYFDDTLFIDYVDFDFCLRCRQAGLIIIEGSHQILEHSMGSSTLHRFLGRTIVCFNHSPLRRYYITRNTLEISRRYIYTDPVWVLSGLLFFSIHNIFTIIYEKQKLAKLAAMRDGTLDFILQRFGPRPS